MSKRRMTEEQREVTRRDFFRRAACAGVGMSAIYAAVRDLRLMNAAVAAGTPPADYKAVICLFLAGGNDSNNWLIPTEDTSTGYQAYAAARKGLAIPRDNLVGNSGPSMVLNTTVSDGHTYAVHPQCEEIRDLLNGTNQPGGARRAAFVANVGTLVYPITRSQYYANPRVVPVPQQLFSHNDQVVQWMTSLPDRDSRTGWGGRMADLVNDTANSAATTSMNVSLAGINTFEVGNTVNPYICSTSGPIGFETATVNGVNLTNVNRLLAGYTSGGTHVAGINDLPLAPSAPTAPQFNIYERSHAGVTRRALDAFETVNAAIAPTASGTYWKTTNWQFVYPRSPATNAGSSLMNQLKMVARLIAGRNVTGHKRQVFFVQVGGYDLHDSLVTVTDPTAGTTNPLTGPHAKLLSEVSQAIGAFMKAMDQLRDPALTTDATVRLGSTDAVTLFTASDFSRTFPMNGGFGSDHGWGSHHLVVGDQVLGGRVYGAFPTLTVSGPDDTSTGRWIPKISVDEYAATMAKWFGVSSANLPQIFPNLPRFANPDLGFMAPSTAFAAPLPSVVVEESTAPIVISSATGTETTSGGTAGRSSKPARSVPAKPTPAKPAVRPVNSRARG